MRTPQEKLICGTVYRVTPLGAKAGRVMAVRLLKLLGPMTASFVDGVVRDPSDGTGALAIGASDAIRELTQRIATADVETISDELAKTTVLVLDGDREPLLSSLLDDHFAARYDAYSQWLGFALTVNFASFFGVSAAEPGAAAGLWQRLSQLVESLSTSPRASTGTSTASQPAENTPTA